MQARESELSKVSNYDLQSGKQVDYQPGGVKDRSGSAGASPNSSEEESQLYRPKLKPMTRKENKLSSKRRKKRSKNLKHRPDSPHNSNEFIIAQLGIPSGSISFSGTKKSMIGIVSSADLNTAEQKLLRGELTDMVGTVTEAPGISVPYLFNREEDMMDFTGTLLREIKVRDRMIETMATLDNKKST